MATAIPPNAAEVASKRPVRQKLLCSGASSTSTGPGLKAEISRKGTSDLKKSEEGSLYRNLFLITASMLGKGGVEPRKIQESGFKKLENTFFNEIQHLQLEVHGVHLLI
jgi:hypothetical protein